MGQTHADDKLLMDRIANGDPDAFDRLFAKYEPYATRYATRLHQSTDRTERVEVEDVVSEAFVKVRRSLPRFRGECAIQTWLHRIVLNTYRDLLRVRNSGPETVNVDSLEILDHGPDPFDIVEGRRQLELLNSHLNALPEPHRSTMVTFYLNGRTCSEMALAMKVPVGTIKSRLSRARRVLKTTLTDNLGTDQFRRSSLQSSAQDEKPTAGTS